VKILLKASINNEDGICYEYAIVTMSKELRTVLRNRRSAFLLAEGADQNIYKISYWDYSVVWYDYFNFVEDAEEGRALLGDVQISELDDKGWIVVDDDFGLPEVLRSRHECDQLVVTCDGFWWECIPKHTDSRAATARIEWSEFEELSL